jgi:hypothetical protein
MSLWKTIKIEPARISAVHGKFLVVETRTAALCIEDPSFVSDPFDFYRGVSSKCIRE